MPQRNARRILGSGGRTSDQYRVTITLTTTRYVEGESGSGGLLLEEIPGILKICADREPTESCPVHGELSIRT